MSNFREFKIWALVIILTNSFNFFVYMANGVIKWSIINDLMVLASIGGVDGGHRHRERERERERDETSKD